MRKRIVVLGAALAALLVIGVPQGASAGDITMHPSGFGEHSYAAWKGDQGLPDNVGNKDQALYMQKHTATETFAAGLVVFKGVAGLPTTAVDPLGFYVREDGWCGAGAPRFNLVIDPVGPVTRQLLFLGCQAMVPGETPVDDNGRSWVQRTTAGLPPGEVVSLAIVFDEGTTHEVGGVSVPLGPGHTWLDNIQVGTRIWTSASDNGNGGFTSANTTVTAAEAEAILGAPLSSLFG
jgi:hypothetical protein